MTEWRIKEISDLTKISVRMLRHYDKLGLLKPSYRSSNGYRWYTAEDLAKLQQIIALKYFGFNLNTIKSILRKHHNIYAHLQAQLQVIKAQSIHLQQVNAALEDILQRLSPLETPNWNDLIALIERYRMTENLRDKLKNTWAGKLSESQFNEYLSIYEQFPEEFAMRDKIIEQVNTKQLGEPEGPDGEKVVYFMHNMAKKMQGFTTRHMKFSSSLLESIQSGKLSQLAATPEGINWLSRAIVSYWLKRWDGLYDSIVENLSSDPSGKIGKKIAGEWNNIIEEYFSSGPRSLALGMILWQEVARQSHRLDQEKKEKLTPSPQELIKQLHIKLYFNPEALTWICSALEAHAK